MADIRELLRLLKELEQDLAHCTRCGMCQSVCPLYRETGRETDVARGKIVLVENLEKEILDDPAAVKQRLDRCLLCGSCSAACPAGVPIMDIFLKTRVIITGYLGLSYAKKAIFRGLLSNPERFDRLIGWMARLQALFAGKASRNLGTSCAGIIMSPLIGDRHFVPPGKRPWHRDASRSFSEPRASRGTRVIFYPGCLVDKNFPGVGDAAVKVLDFHGADVFVPSAVPCCGIPALAAGDAATFESLVRQNVNIFEPLDYDFIVTPCATCTFTLRKVWPAMSRQLGEDIRQKAISVSEKTLDINEFLADIIGVRPGRGRASKMKTVTWHDPCHLKKSLGIEKQPRTVLAAGENARLVEMRESDSCCGMGGSFNLEHYEVSKNIGQRKLDSIIETGAEVVATGCPACMLQIADLVSRSGHSINVKHSIQIYAEALHGIDTVPAKN
ncbi:MAG: (Fe-S)-binding protein [Desulfobacteraceae bacterium]|nr:(Fe-S)-binding protein [Desulfobacteraceae bacterium]